MVANRRKRSQYSEALAQVAAAESLPCPPKYKPFDKSVSRWPTLLPSFAGTETRASGCGFVKTSFFFSLCLRASVVKNNSGNGASKEGEKSYRTVKL